MKRSTWIMAAAGGLLAIAGLTTQFAAAQENRNEGRSNEARQSESDRENESRPNGQRTDSPQIPAERNGNRQEHAGRGILGVFLGPSPTTGARIQRVEPQSAAAQAGIRSGDFILSINGTKISRPEEVPQAIADLEPGREAEITIWRNGETHEMTVTLGERRTAGFRGAEFDPANDRREGARDNRSGGFGMMLADAGEGKGARIQSVAPDSPAARAGLREGDVIYGVDDAKVARVSDLAEFLNQHQGGEDAWFSIFRGEEEYAVQVPMQNRSRFQGFDQSSDRRDFASGQRGRPGWLGMALADTQDGEGIRIVRVAPDGPAERAGLKEGDVIKGVDRTSVSRAADLMMAIRSHQPGDDVWFSIVRNDEEHAVRVAMAARPAFFEGSQFRGDSGDFADGAPGGGGRFQEDHQRLLERIDRLEAEVKSLRSQLGNQKGDRQERTNELPPERNE